MDPTTAIQATHVDWGTVISQLGFGGVIFAAFMVLLRWVLRTQEKILDSSREERVTAQLVNHGYLKSIEQMNIQSSEFHKQVTDAHTFQRSEHEKMLEGLNKVCIINQQHSDCLEKVKENLEEQGKALLRINGFKKE